MSESGLLEIEVESGSLSPSVSRENSAESGGGSHCWSSGLLGKSSESEHIIIIMSSQEEIYKAIQTAIEEEDHEKVIELADTLPDGERDTIDTLKRTAILKRGPTKDDLHLFEKAKSSDSFSYVYALHASGSNEKAITEFESLGLSTSDYKSAHLKAQIVSCLPNPLAL